MIRYGRPASLSCRCSRRVISRSSPTVSVQYPPTCSSRSRRNSPQAPDTIISDPSPSQPVRPSRNARRYSISWKPATAPRGTRGSIMRPCSIREEFPTRTVPPTAATRPGSSRNGRTITASASGSRIESASVMQTYAVAGDIHAAVERIGSTAVVFSHQRDLRIAGAAPHLDQRQVGHDAAGHGRNLMEPVGGDHRAGGGVVGAVVDQHQLVQRIPLGQAAIGSTRAPPTARCGQEPRSRSRVSAVRRTPPRTTTIVAGACAARFRSGRTATAPRRRGSGPGHRSSRSPRSRSAPVSFRGRLDQACRVLQRRARGRMPTDPHRQVGRYSPTPPRQP